MFKYIKKLTSVVVMFAVIIVFSSSKVYAGSAFSMPPNVEKATEVVGIVNDIATLTGIGLKSRQDVDMDKVKADKVDAKIAQLNKIVVNMVTKTAYIIFFSTKDVEKLDKIMASAMIGSSIRILSDINKKKGPDAEHYNIRTNKISPINIYDAYNHLSLRNVGISADSILDNGITVGYIYRQYKRKEKNALNLSPKLAGPVDVCTLEIKVPKSNTLSSDRHYEGVQEADGSWTLSDAGLKQFLLDDAIAQRSRDSSGGDGGDGM